MNQQQAPFQNTKLDRRAWLHASAAGFGSLALAGLCAQMGSAKDAMGVLPQRAKHVIFLFMRGGPAQMETFDYKPRLNADHGKPTGKGAMQYVGSRWKFDQYGDSGLWVSELFPHVAQHADALCVLNAMQSSHLNHPEASDLLHTGSFQFIRPSLGSWVLQGLGSENANLPGFVTIKPPNQWGGAKYYGSGFLPAQTQGTPIGTLGQSLQKVQLPNVQHPRLSLTEQRQQLDLTQQLNRGLLERTAEDAAVAGLMDSLELAFRMQTALPEVLDLSRETAETHALYGIGKSPTDDFGRQCLMARRLVESGVRFVELTHDNWDHHGGLSKAMPQRCSEVDQPIAALLTDLQQRGLLTDTLVVWGGEFGRTPDDPTTDGRGHNKDGFTMWLAGGGVRGGHVQGVTDEHGFAAVEGAVHIHDLHATMLHLLGLDHLKLTFKYAGRDFRLTDVHGRVVHEIVS